MNGRAERQSAKWPTDKDGCSDRKTLELLDTQMNKQIDGPEWTGRQRNNLLNR